MNLAQLFLQLGIAGALLFVFYRLADKLGGKLIDNWAASEKRKLAVHAAAEVKRTNAIAGGFQRITDRLDENGKTLTEIKAELGTKAVFTKAFEEVTGQHELPIPQPIISGTDDTEIQIEPPRPMARVRTGQTPPAGVPMGQYSHIAKRAATKVGG